LHILNQLKEKKLIAVIRADSEAQGYKTAKAVLEGGIVAIEITFSVPRAETLIQRLKEEFKSEILIGAGTVLNVEMCKKAIDHGAEYIVSPGFDRETAIYCHEHNIPYIPGCMTVTEMMNAMQHHSNIVKLFPGSHFNPSFIKNIKAPLPNIGVMVTGGVDLDNLKTWFKAGADIIGIGSALTKYQKDNDFDKITEAAKRYNDAIKELS